MRRRMFSTRNNRLHMYICVSTVKIQLFGATSDTEHLSHIESTGKTRIKNSETAENPFLIADYLREQRDKCSHSNLTASLACSAQINCVTGNGRERTTPSQEISEPSVSLTPKEKSVKTVLARAPLGLVCMKPGREKLVSAPTLCPHANSAICEL